MNAYFKFSIFVLVFLFSFSSSANEKTTNNCEFMPEHLYSCDKFECQTASSDSQKTNIITQKIKGIDKKGYCIHEQKTNNGETIICHYEKESRKFMSIKMQDAKNGSIGKNADDIEYAEALMGEIFFNECEVFDKDGNKMNFSDAIEPQEDIDFKSKGKTASKGASILKE